MSTEPFVSIVTPVFNGEKYLRECIDSIVAQTYSNWEYVIVDNRSTDRTLEIATEYAQRTPNIRVHRNERHLGMLQNWNHALEQTSPESKYCKVVHADDWLFPECIARMVQCAEAHPTVGIVSSYRLEENKVTCCGLPSTTTVASGREICRRRFLGDEHLFGTPSTLLMRSELIRTGRPFYSEDNMHADTEVCFEILSKWEFGFIHQVLSFTRRSNENNTTFCRHFNTFLPAELLILKRWGPFYLSREEYAAVQGRMMKAYYRYLGRRLFERRGKEFWDYHRKGLEKIDRDLSYSKALKAGLLVIYNRVLEFMKVD